MESLAEEVNKELLERVEGKLMGFHVMSLLKGMLMSKTKDEPENKDKGKSHAKECEEDAKEAATEITSSAGHWRLARCPTRRRRDPSRPPQERRTALRPALADQAGVGLAAQDDPHDPPLALGQAEDQAAGGRAHPLVGERRTTTTSLARRNERFRGEFCEIGSVRRRAGAFYPRFCAEFSAWFGYRFVVT